jgi:hypothetical protein
VTHYPLEGYLKLENLPDLPLDKLVVSDFVRERRRRITRDDQCYQLSFFKDGIYKKAKFCYPWHLVTLCYKNINMNNCAHGLDRLSIELNNFKFGYGRLYKKLNNNEYIYINKYIYDQDRGCSLLTGDINNPTSREPLDANDPRCQHSPELEKWFYELFALMQKHGFNFGDKRRYPDPDFIKFMDEFENVPYRK